MDNLALITDIPYPQSPAQIASQHVLGSDCACLDSCQARQSVARYSAIATAPVATLSQFDGQPARLISGGRTLAQTPHAWDLWQQVHRRLPSRPAGETPITPGWFGYIGFETARQLERLPASQRESLGLPWFRMALFDAVIVLDHHERRAHLISDPAIAATLDQPPTDTATLRGQWTAALNAPVAPDTAGPPRHWRPDMPRDAYRDMIRRAIDYIAAGDIYQVNLCQRLSIAGISDPRAAYTALRTGNPAGYAAFLRWDDSAVLSVSPELFLQVRGRDVLTRPIKGTRPRTGDETRDAAHRAALLASAKDAAELTMIVDLHRNDLGRVCTPGSVRVLNPRLLETHPTVYHTVAEIAGRLRPEINAIDALRAGFPAGSVTGVPKIRAIEIIDELENTARGVYTGAIGHVGLDGSATFSVAIRTVQWHAGHATLHVGGGIVADSDPDDEYAETLAKGRGILTALRASQSPNTIDAERAAPPEQLRNGRAVAPQQE